MKLKLDDQGHVVVVDGKPVYVHDDGKEIPFDAMSATQKISQLNREAQGHRERAETAEGKLKAFEGIADPASAIKALETVSNLDQKKLIDAGEVEKVKAEISKAFQTQLDAAASERDAFKTQLYDEKIGGSFARSKFIGEKMAIPADLVQARFGQSFKVEDGKIVAYDQSGNKVFSRVRAGELADFEEAIETLVDQYPHKESILKGTGASGGGASQGNQSTGGKKTITRSQFDALNPTERISAIQNGTAITD